jgi:ferredoxin-type protein NapG
MDRRGFFKKGVEKLKTTAVKKADEVVEQQVQWVRPPYALNELEFLLSCTRCGDCVEACPEQTIFNLPVKFGTKVMNTPALDLINKSCLLCETWPCVSACQSGALQLNSVQGEEGQTVESPGMKAQFKVDASRCLSHLDIGCGACEGSCPVTGAMAWAGNKPEIHIDICVGCGQCRQVCIVDPKAIDVRV